MQKERWGILGLVIASVTLTACDRGFDNPVGDESSYNAGQADFSRFVSIGDSLTAGYADGALYLSGQENSYPSLLAKQLKKVGGGEFKQPLVNDNLGGLLIGGSRDSDSDGEIDFKNRLVLDAVTKKPIPIEGTPITEVSSPLTGQFNNMSVPGAKSFHFSLAGYGDLAGLDAGTANPYFVRFSSSSTATVIGDAAAQIPSFMVMWIGNNDILAYATKGGSGVDQALNFDPTTYGSNDITSPVVFDTVYRGLVGAITTANAEVKGVLLSIPDVSMIPYFTTVPFNPLPLDQASAESLNAAYAPYNGGIQLALAAEEITSEDAEKRTISFAAGENNAVVILDESLTDLTSSNSALTNMRQATAEDLLVFTSAAKIGTRADASNPATVWGAGMPLQDGDVLIPTEIQAIETARLAFNATIKSVADANDNFLYVDAAALVAELSTTGVDYGLGSINATYATGGAYSLDGVHPTARGYAVIANQIIEDINNGFGANIPVINPGAHTTIFFK